MIDDEPIEESVPESDEPEQGETKADETKADETEADETEADETGEPAEVGPLYRDKRTARFAAGERVKEFQGFEEQAKKRLVILNAAVTRNGLAMLPSNRFEALKGDRKGQFSIRINQQWRLCFEWSDTRERPFNIEIVDYH